MSVLHVLLYLVFPAPFNVNLRKAKIRFVFGSKAVRVYYIIQYTLQFSQYLNKRARQIKSNTEIVMKHVFQFNEIVFNVICYGCFFPLCVFFFPV